MLGFRITKLRFRITKALAQHFLAQALTVVDRAVPRGCGYTRRFETSAQDLSRFDDVGLCTWLGLKLDTTSNMPPMRSPEPQPTRSELLHDAPSER